MPCWIIKIDRRIQHIAVAIERLRVGGTWNQRIWLDEAVNIRRTHQLTRKKKQVVKVQTKRTNSAGMGDPRRARSFNYPMALTKNLSEFRNKYQEKK